MQSCKKMKKTLNCILNLLIVLKNLLIAFKNLLIDTYL